MLFTLGTQSSPHSAAARAIFDFARAANEEEEERGPELPAFYWFGTTLSRMKGRKTHYFEPECWSECLAVAVGASENPSLRESTCREWQTPKAAETYRIAS